MMVVLGWSLTHNKADHKTKLHVKNASILGILSLVGLGWWFNPELFKTEEFGQWRITESYQAIILICITLDAIFIVNWLKKRNKPPLIQKLSSLALTAMLGVTIALHAIWFKVELKGVIQTEQTQMKKVIEMSESTFMDVCKNFTWECWLGASLPVTEKNPQITPSMTHQFEQWAANPACRSEPCQELVSGLKENEPQSIPIAYLNSDHQIRIIADTYFVPNQIKEIKTNVSWMALYSSLFWWTVTIGVWYTHRKGRGE